MHYKRKGHLGRHKKQGSLWWNQALRLYGNSQCVGKRAHRSASQRNRVYEPDGADAMGTFYREPVQSQSLDLSEIS
jgi:hypothetical protein